jgi:hypothetical protein
MVKASGREVSMSVQHTGDDARGESPGASLGGVREALLARARPLPPPEDMIIEDLSDEEAEAFWVAITQA